MWLCLCVCVCEVGGTVRLCKQAASYFLALVPPETLEALSEAPLCHLKVVSKRKAREVCVSVCEGDFSYPTPSIHA